MSVTRLALIGSLSHDLLIEICGVEDRTSRPEARSRNSTEPRCLLPFPVGLCRFASRIPESVPSFRGRSDRQDDLQLHTSFPKLKRWRPLSITDAKHLEWRQPNPFLLRCLIWAPLSEFGCGSSGNRSSLPAVSSCNAAVALRQTARSSSPKYLVTLPIPSPRILPIVVHRRVARAHKLLLISILLSRLTQPP